jgi:hemolysin activation/secretion protein
MILTGQKLRHRSSVSFALSSLSAALLLSALAATPAGAQSAAPSSVEPGKIENRIRKPAAPAPEEKPATVPALPTMDLKPDGIEGEFVLAGVEVIGASVYPVAEFAPLYEPLMASQVSLAQIQDLVKAITQKYRDDGYFLATASAEPQDLALGILRIRIAEGAITRVRFEGDLGGRGELVKRYADKITAACPAKLAHLERYMLLIDDLPGTAVDGSLNPIDSAKGEFELVMRMSDRTLDGSASIDNRGTRAVGRYQALLNANLNTGALGGTRTGVTLFTIPATPEELVYVQVTQEHRIGSEGLRGWVSASHSVADVGAQYDETNLGNKSTRAVLGLAYPLIRSRDHNLEISGRFDVVNQRQDDSNVREFDDRLRVLRFGADYNLNDSLDGQNSLSLELSRGLDILGASEGEYPSQSRAPSRTNGRAEFTKLMLSASRRQKIGKT